MLKIYFKQTIALLKQNRLISSISIIGTAMAVMMVMVLILIQNMNEVPMSPELNRDRMLYMKFEQERSKDTTNYFQNSGSLSYENYKTYLSDLKTPELMSITTGDFNNQVMIWKEGSKDMFPSKKLYTDDNYWKIMSFDFIEGKPYDKADYDAALRKAVLKESKAKQLFGKESPIGRTILVGFVPFEVIAVIKDVSPIFTFCGGDVFLPYTTMNDEDYKYCYLLILAKSRSDFDAINQEVRNAERKYSAINSDKDASFWGPYDQKNQKENYYANIGVDEAAVSKRYLFIFMILLIVPAINLSSFSLSQIKKRTEEIGIRKAFGATNFSVVKQVLIENFLTSLIGGIIGMILSFFIIMFLREWLLDIPKGGSIPIGSYISPYIFMVVFVICLILNLLSAGIPALSTVRMNIIDSLNRK